MNASGRGICQDEDTEECREGRTDANHSKSYDEDGFASILRYATNHRILCRTTASMRSLHDSSVRDETSGGTEDVERGAAGKKYYEERQRCRV